MHTTFIVPTLRVVLPVPGSARSRLSSTCHVSPGIGKTEPEMSENLKTETREKHHGWKCSILCTMHMRCSVYQGGAIF